MDIRIDSGFRILNLIQIFNVNFIDFALTMEYSEEDLHGEGVEDNGGVYTMV